MMNLMVQMLYKLHAILNGKKKQQNLNFSASTAQIISRTARQYEKLVLLVFSSLRHRIVKFIRNFYGDENVIIWQRSKMQS